MCIRFLDFAVKNTAEFIDAMPKSLRKGYGQFFTSKETAEFMAGMFEIDDCKSNLSILDPGAGSGVLSIALIERLEQCQKVQEIDLTCYETDLSVIDILKNNLEYVKNHSKIKINYTIQNQNYILSQSAAYARNAPDDRKYDYVIANPPYKKIGKNAPEALVMQDVCYGAPNLYFLFAAMSLFNVKTQGEMVYIIPRSWTSGAYFKAFREKLLRCGVIEWMHLFISRDKVFDKENVLQETMILKIKKSDTPPEKIRVTSSDSNRDFSQLTEFAIDYSSVISGNERYVYLVTNLDEALVLTKLQGWSNTLPSLGLKMKTGLTVDFRNKELLRNNEDPETVPLFYSQHIKNGKVVFPIGKENEYLLKGNSALLQGNKNYLFVKRFTSKEEKRRLQCGIYLANKFAKYAQISTQNKINFISGNKDLSECTVCGLYVLFNSSIYDRYYRILNGSTQVNSTEVNNMPVPSLELIEKMGKDLIKAHDLSETACDTILGRYL